MTVWKGLEIKEVILACGAKTRGGGVFRKTLQIWARDDSYSQGYWVIPYWGKLVPEERFFGRNSKSIMAYWVGEYPVGKFQVTENGETFDVNQYGCIDGRPDKWEGSYLANLGPYLDEATDEEPLFYIVALEDDQLEQMDAKVATEGYGWDSSSCSVGNRYVLCCRKDSLQREVLWSTRYAWGDRRDVSWRGFAEQETSGHGLPARKLAEVTHGKRKGKAKRKMDNLKGKVAKSAEQLQAERDERAKRRKGEVKDKDEAEKVLETPSLEPKPAETCDDSLSHLAICAESDAALREAGAYLSEGGPEADEVESDVPSEGSDESETSVDTLASLNWTRLYDHFIESGLPCNAKGKVTLYVAEGMGLTLRNRHNDKSKGLFNLQSLSVLQELNSNGLPEIRVEMRRRATAAGLPPNAPLTMDFWKSPEKSAEQDAQDADKTCSSKDT